MRKEAGCWRKEPGEGVDEEAGAGGRGRGLVGLGPTTGLDLDSASEGCSEQRSMAGGHGGCAERALGARDMQEPSQDAEPVHQGGIRWGPRVLATFPASPERWGWGTGPGIQRRLRSCGTLAVFSGFSSPFLGPLVPTSTGQKMNLYLLSEEIIDAYKGTLKKKSFRRKVPKCCKG